MGMCHTMLLQLIEIVAKDPMERLQRRAVEQKDDDTGREAHCQGPFTDFVMATTTTVRCCALF
jgi:hypothetical protein